MPTWLRLLDPGRVRLRIAIRTIIAALAALLVTGAVTRTAGLPGGMVVIATVVAVLVSRSLHATSLPHRLTALLYVPVIGILAAFTGRFMLHQAWLGAMAYVAAIGASRYLMRFGGTVRRLGRLALTPLISVLVVPVPPSAAEATGPWWGGLAGLVAVLCVLASQALLPSRPAREAARAADDFRLAAARLRHLPPAARARTLHRIALTAEDRLTATRLPDRASLDALSATLLTAEVLLTTDPPVTPPAHSPSAQPTGRPGLFADPGLLVKSGLPAEPELPARPGLPVKGRAAGSEAAAIPRPRPRSADAALDALRDQAAALRTVRAPQWPAPEPSAPPRRPGGLRDPQPQTRLSLQLAAAMAAAFAAGHLLFHHRWTWTVITAFVVTSAARSRGDVVQRSGMRVGGAFAGAVTGTLVAHLVAGAPAAGVTVIFCYLLIGLWLRDVSYALWAFFVTSLLAVLYTLNGEQGTALIVQRPEGILAGSACGIAAACFVLPLRTETVMRGRAARALRTLQDLLSAAREPEPEPAVLRRLARTLDLATRDLAEAAAPARTHRALFHRRRTAAHAADWADSLAACAHAARALAATDPAELAASRTQLGLTALNTGQVRRRLGRRPDAAPPRPLRAGPPHLVRLNASLAELYDRLPAPAAPAVTATSPAPAAAG